MKVDDPVGAVGVHFANGLLGTICVGLFSTGQNGVGEVFSTAADLSSSVSSF